MLFYLSGDEFQLFQLPTLPENNPKLSSACDAPAPCAGPDIAG